MLCCHGHAEEASDGTGTASGLLTTHLGGLNAALNATDDLSLFNSSLFSETGVGGEEDPSGSLLTAPDNKSLIRVGVLGVPASIFPLVRRRAVSSLMLLRRLPLASASQPPVEPTVR